MKEVITVSGLSKVFKPAQGNKEHWALNDISFQLNSGDTLAIIGRNGSGKSTLLKILAGVYKPTAGSACIKGRVASVLDLGAGFHPDLTGRENIFFHGEVMGFEKSEIRAKLEEIIDFSGIEKYINEPVKTYSSGMFVRLASSVIALLSYDVLILDEVMGMGDARYKVKFSKKLNELTQQGTTIILASHNVNELFGSNSFMWIDEGRIKRFKNDDQVLIEYLETNSRPFKGGKGPAYDSTGEEFGAQLQINGLLLNKISFGNKQGVPQSGFRYDENIYLNVEVTVVEENCPFAFMFALVDEFNTIVLGTAPSVNDPEFRTPAVGTKLNFQACLPNKILNFGNYYLDVYGYDRERRIRNLQKHLLSFNLIKEQIPTFTLRGNKMPGVIQPVIDWKIISGS